MYSHSSKILPVVIVKVSVKMISYLYDSHGIHAQHNGYYMVSMYLLSLLLLILCNALVCIRFHYYMYHLPLTQILMNVPVEMEAANTYAITLQAHSIALVTVSMS